MTSETVCAALSGFIAYRILNALSQIARELKEANRYKRREWNAFDDAARGRKEAR